MSLLLRRLLSTAAAAAHGPLPIRVALTDSAGRGVFATRPIAAGEVLHSAQPLVSHPSRSLLHEVCYSCLRRKAGKGGDSSGGCYFCSDACREHAKGFHGIENNLDWSLLDDHCSLRGLKYPYMVKRLACMVISGAVGADSLDILQPARLHQGIISEMEEEFELLDSTFRKAGFQEELAAYAKLKTLRDIDEGEELRICYIDASMDVNARQKILAEGFGLSVVVSGAYLEIRFYVSPGFLQSTCIQGWRGQATMVGGATQFSPGAMAGPVAHWRVGS